MDLANLTTVKECALGIIECNRYFDILVLNAGVLMPDQKMTIDGFETTFQVNYLAHYYFATLLLAHFAKESHPIKVVTLTSVLHR